VHARRGRAAAERGWERAGRAAHRAGARDAAGKACAMWLGKRAQAAVLGWLGALAERARPLGHAGELGCGMGRGVRGMGWQGGRWPSWPGRRGKALELGGLAENWAAR
jgi:hypothetical protein